MEKIKRFVKNMSRKEFVTRTMKKSDVGVALTRIGRVWKFKKKK